MGLNHSNSEWYNPNVMFVFLRIAWARSPVKEKEIVFEFFKKREYPKGGEGGCTPVNSWQSVQPISPNPDPISEP